MSPAKIVRIVGVVLAIAVALVPAIPEGALLLSVAGLVVGYYVAAGNRANLFLMVIVLVLQKQLARYQELAVILAIYWVA